MKSMDKEWCHIRPLALLLGRVPSSQALSVTSLAWLKQLVLLDLTVDQPTLLQGYKPIHKRIYLDGRDFYPHLKS